MHEDARTSIQLVETLSEAHQSYMTSKVTMKVRRFDATIARNHTAYSSRKLSIVCA